MTKKFDKTLEELLEENGGNPVKCEESKGIIFTAYVIADTGYVSGIKHLDGGTEAYSYRGDIRFWRKYEPQKEIKTRKLYRAVKYVNQWEGAFFGNYYHPRKYWEDFFGIKVLEWETIEIPEKYEDVVAAPLPWEGDNKLIRTRN
jgi:hypothetical protein